MISVYLEKVTVFAGFLSAYSENLHGDNKAKNDKIWIYHETKKPFSDFF
jgi:hypothetical protein